MSVSILCFRWVQHHAGEHVCVAIFVLRVYVLRAFVYSCRRLRWVLPQIKQLSDPLVSLIVCVCAHMRVCVCVCFLVLAKY